MPLTYSSYLQLDQLLRLQEPASRPPEHDEILFIVIHQTYELWFKQLLHEFNKVKGDLTGNDLFGAIHTFKRCRTIMKTLVGQMDILETMTPMSFTSFRERLDTASGFQSHQYREVEFDLGYKRPEMIRFHPQGSVGHTALTRRLAERTVIDHFYDFLVHQGADLPQSIRERDVTQPVTANVQVQIAILRIYKSDPRLAILFELMADFDEGFQEWRYRHVKLVERTIGNKKGTGGSLGVEFLKKSLFMPCFPDLWEIRHEL